ncbi:BlaI/MecI/CopY family transcriptional regulator [Rhodococcus sp. BGS-1C]|uniref:BlaI/MecI/CopY family transcriptional regulator n=1 Tax=unclassified Rhodococcus (in: high G+C Gram-positive bacteria) TaxID=192944 RepID=UPI000964176A|nr:BlaI/MecI/CopY family transcriptional regulator [Rhodococcus sp. KRD197]OLT31229.1 CopY family transcriptional regulator [Rhodococcus sp. CUA-806]
MRRGSGELEESILRLLGEHQELSVSDVRERLSADLAHTTVMTALVRLREKGLLTRRRKGRSFIYALQAPYEDLPALRAAIRMRSELDAREERADVLANFVAALGPDDEAVLRELLARDRSNQDPDPS